MYSLKNVLGKTALSAVMLGGCTLAFAQSTPAAPTTPTATASTSASQSDPDFSIGIQISTLGLGAQLGKQFTPNFAARVGVNSYSYSHNFSASSVSYDGSLKLSSVSLLADLYPTKTTGFHVTGGLIFNNNAVDANATPSGSTVTINGTVYPTSQVGTLNTHSKWPNTDGYLGIGVGKPSGPGGRTRLYLDLGAMFEGSANVNVSNHGNTVATPASLDSDTKSTIQNALNNIKVYPVATIGIAFHI